MRMPRYVRIKNPLPGEEGRLLLFSQENGECRVALRGGSFRNFDENDVEHVHARETAKVWLRYAVGYVCRPTVFLTLFIVWMFTIWHYFGWRVTALAVLASIAAVMWDRTRSV